LVVIASLATGPDEPRAAKPPPWAAAPPGPAADQGAAAPAPPAPAPPERPGPVGTAAELARQLRDGVEVVRLRPGVTYDLNDLPDDGPRTGLFFEGRSLEISGDPQNPAVIPPTVEPGAGPRPDARPAAP